MSEEEFWNCTHKKLLALIDIHNERMKAKYGDGEETKEEKYIDEIIL